MFRQRISFNGDGHVNYSKFSKETFHIFILNSVNNDTIAINNVETGETINIIHPQFDTTFNYPEDGEIRRRIDGFVYDNKGKIKRVSVNFVNLESVNMRNNKEDKFVKAKLFWGWNGNIK